MKQHTQGFTLIELMLGLAIGILITAMAAQTVNLFHQHSRTTNSGNDAFVDNVNGLHSIEYDIKMAGLGIIASRAITCTAINAVYGSNTFTNQAIAPVTISRTGNTPDVITVFHGNSSFGASPSLIIGSGNNFVTVNYMSTDLVAGNYAMIATPGAATTCSIVSVTAVTNNGINTTIQYSGGGTVAVTNNVTQITNLGNTVGWNTWTVQNNSLAVTNQLTAQTITVADDIVQIKTQYGVSDGTTAAVQEWVDPTGVWATPTTAQLARIRAVRIALVAQSAQQEKPTSGSTCNTTPTAPVPWPGGTAVDLSNVPNWQCFRYRVLHTVIPLKNISVGGVS